MPNKGKVKYAGKYVSREDRERLVQAAAKEIPAIPELEERFQSSEDYKVAFDSWMQRCQELVRNEMGTVRKQYDEIRQQVADLRQIQATMFTNWSNLHDELFEVACISDATNQICHTLEEDVARLKVEVEELRKTRSVPCMVSCLIMRNVAEMGEEREEDLRERVISLLFTQEERDKGDPANLILNVSRLGKRKVLDRPRLLLVTCSSVESKRLVKRRGYKLKHLRASIDHALTLRQRQHRAAQWPLIQAAMAAGLGWSWDDQQPDRLVVRPPKHPHAKKSTEANKPIKSTSNPPTPTANAPTMMDISSP